MLFQYIGDDEAPKRTTIFGYDFRLRGKPVEVTDARSIEKLKGNASFIEVSEDCSLSLEAQEEEPKEVESIKKPVRKPGETFDLPPLEEDLSELTEEELEKLTSPKKKSK